MNFFIKAILLALVLIGSSFRLQAQQMGEASTLEFGGQTFIYDPVQSGLYGGVGSSGYDTFNESGGGTHSIVLYHDTGSDAQGDNGTSDAYYGVVRDSSNGNTLALTTGYPGDLGSALAGLGITGAGGGSPIASSDPFSGITDAGSAAVSVAESSVGAILLLALGIVVIFFVYAMISQAIRDASYVEGQKKVPGSANYEP